MQAAKHSAVIKNNVIITDFFIFVSFERKICQKLLNIKQIVPQKLSKSNESARSDVLHRVLRCAILAHKGVMIMKTVVPQIIGLLAVAILLLSYQQKKRSGIILLNVISRCLYITQYLMLGAFSGAVMDVLGAVASVIAGKKHSAFVKKHLKAVVALVFGAIGAVGLAMALGSNNPRDFFSLGAVLLQITALWLTREKNIRIVSLTAVPLWFVYNVSSHALGACVGDLLSGCSIVLAMIRYGDFKSNK